MDRLTEYDYLAGTKVGDLKVGIDERRAFHRLAAYEDTGLMPEEVSALIAFYKYGMREGDEKIPNALGTFIRLRELAEADKDGKVIIAPCKVGESVFLLFEGKVESARVQGISVSANGKDTILHFGGYPAVNYFGSEFGKTVFLAREAAEAALKCRGKESEG